MFSAVHAISKVICNFACTKKQISVKFCMKMIVPDLGCTNSSSGKQTRNVLVLAIGYFQKMTRTELWIVFGFWKNFRYIASLDIANFLGPGKARARLAIHTLTGCDTLSFFAGRGKNTAWNV
jgi:hypothetical protein